MESEEPPLSAALSESAVERAIDIVKDVRLLLAIIAVALAFCASYLGHIAQALGQIARAGSPNETSAQTDFLKRWRHWREMRAERRRLGL